MFYGFTTKRYYSFPQTCQDLWLNEHTGARFATVTINIMLARFQQIGAKYDMNMEYGFPIRAPLFVLEQVSEAGKNAAGVLQEMGLISVVSEFKKNPKCPRHNIVAVGIDGSESADAAAKVKHDYFLKNPLVTEKYLIDSAESGCLLYAGDYWWGDKPTLVDVQEWYSLQGGTSFLRNPVESALKYNCICRCWK